MEKDLQALAGTASDQPSTSSASPGELQFWNQTCGIGVVGFGDASGQWACGFVHKTL